MNNKLVMYVFIILMIMCTFSCLVPYPVFSSNSILTVDEQKFVNDINEQELQQTSTGVNIAVKNLNWFDVVNGFFPTFQKTRVIDVETKKEYYVMRTGGHFHADVETVDTSNTNIFKSLYDYEWSWTRRPVWVEINGTFVAASINGMPHGYSLVSGNNEGGHTCIHFLQSKTHGTKRVDEAHQDAVQTAYDRANELSEYLFKSKRY